MALRSIVIVVLIFILVITGGFLIYSLFHRPLVHHLNSDMQLIGFIAPENTQEFNQHAILNGEGSVLVVDHASLLYQQLLQKIPQAKFLTREEVFSVNNLHLVDKNADGVLTEDDPLFEHLFVIHFFDNGQQDTIKNLSAAGIKGIDIKNVTPTGNHEVIMSDGSQRTLYGISKIEKTP